MKSFVFAHIFSDKVTEHNLELLSNKQLHTEVCTAVCIHNLSLHQILSSYGNHIKKLRIHNITFISNDISKTRYFVRNVFSRQQLKAFSPLTQLCLRCYRQKIRRIVLIVSAKKVYYHILQIFRWSLTSRYFKRVMSL